MNGKDFELRTRNGHNMYDMASMLQKAIRRCDIDRAGYAGMELFGRFHTYLWKRLVVISAEDVYGIMTQEIVSLKVADDIANAGRKGYDRDPLFVAKAITLLCMARKNRDGCYVACNFMNPDRILLESEIDHFDPKDMMTLKGEIPDWVFDVHTLKGKAMGRTDLNMAIDEQLALTPHQQGLFDDDNWGNYFEQARTKGKVGDQEYKEYQEFAKGRNYNSSKSIIEEE